MTSSGETIREFSALSASSAVNAFFVLTAEIAEHAEEDLVCGENALRRPW
jgi:hypothetical protein